MINHIHVIGDSHVNQFAGRGFIPHEIHFATAYNMINDDSQMQGRQKTFEVLEHINENEYVLFSFGEIDCRCHLWKHTDPEHPGDSIKDVVKICVDRYVQFLCEVKEKGFKHMIVFGPIASALEESEGIDTALQLRNYAAFLFNEYLEEKCKEHGFIFISVFLNVVDNHYMTDPKMYIDNGVHLKPEIQTKYFLEQLMYYFIFKHHT